jgi:hypothetical protein
MLPRFFTLSICGITDQWDDAGFVVEGAGVSSFLAISLIGFVSPG